MNRMLTHNGRTHAGYAPAGGTPRSPCSALSVRLRSDATHGLTGPGPRVQRPEWPRSATSSETPHRVARSKHYAELVPPNPLQLPRPSGACRLRTGRIENPPRARLPSYCSRTGDDVLYSKTSAPPIPYPPTRAPALPIIVLRSCVAALERKLPAKSALSSVQRVTAFTVPSGKKRAKNRPPPDTVLSRKNIPYRPTNSCSPNVSPVPRRESCLQHPCKSRVFISAGLGGGYTVLSDKLYRTRLQALPYRTTSLTVPSGKGYRTLRQALPYPAAKHGVPSGKSCARCPCKTQEKRRRAVRAPCSCFLLNVLMLFGDGD